MAVVLVCVGCDDQLNVAGRRSVGLGESNRGDGPVVVWDTTALPLPEIPLPNDAATRLDPTSPTGRRLNISLEATTEYERRTRRSFNRLDGFGTLGPLYVSFDRPLDLTNLRDRHAANHDFRDDAIYLLNVDPDCSRYGEEVTLDMGRGRFPVTFFRHATRTPDPEAPGGYRTDERGNIAFQFDPRGEYNNMLYEERTEDRNTNGVLDPGEDSDRDGVLDFANFVDPYACMDLDVTTVDYDRCVADNLMTWYDRASNTLVLRPVWALEQQCTYAVVLTDRVVGLDGSPVVSPFPGVSPRDQTAALAPVGGLLERYGLSAGDVGFAWTFTTGTMTYDLEALRAGLYGSGPFARLAAEFPVTSLRLWKRGELDPGAGDPEATSLPGACSGIGLTLLWQYGQGEWDPNMCALESDNSAIGGMFGGTFEAPDLLVDREDDFAETARYPGTHDESWELDYTTGEAIYGTTEVTFWCTVPNATAGDCTPNNPEGRPFCEPFPTILYSHGYGGARAEVTSHMGRHNAMGYAACSLDAYGHGLNAALAVPEFAPIESAAIFFEQYDLADFTQMLTRGRDRDLNNDGIPDPGADQWTADLFHTRDMVRQSVLEHIQFVRILRSMDGRSDDDGAVLGDANQNGIPDIGGPQNIVSMWGISLGGIISGVAAGAEPGLDAISPNAGGAALSDVSTRCSQPGVPEAVVLPVLGPFVAGCLPVDDHQRPLAAGQTTTSDCFLHGFEGQWAGGVMRLGFFLNNNARLAIAEFAQAEGVMPGDRVLVENLNNGDRGTAWVSERGFFRTAAASDAVNAIDRRPILGMDDTATEPVRVPDVETLDRLGDRLRVTFYVGDTEAVRTVVESFDRDVTFQGTVYPAGFPLVAMQEGLAQERNTPEYRRFFGFAQYAIAQGDPGVWAARYFMDPVDASYDSNWRPGRQHVLVMPTAGDNNVPTHTGITMARNAGLLGSWLRDESLPAEHGWRELHTPDPRYGVSIDEELVDRYVVEGDQRLQRYADNPDGPNALYDIDNPSNGLAAFSCGPSDWSGSEQGCPPELAGQEIFFGLPHPEPGRELRLNRARGDGTYDAFRVPVLRPAGQHGIYNAQAFRVWDNDAYMVNYTVRFLGTGGRMADDVEGCDCSGGLPSFRNERFAEYPSFGVACQADDPAVPDAQEPDWTMNVCSPACAEAWGIETPERAVCDVD